jgi:hypothetical protein
MSEKEVKKNPLLGDDLGETSEPAKEPDKAKPAKAEAKTVTPAPNTPAAKVKADALAKFPKDIVAQTKYILDNSEHVNFIVPQQEGEIGEETVQINGYKLTIKKNVMVNIPIQVGNLLAEKYRIGMTAGQEKRIDRASDVTDALS